jgi:hypothetical protein
VAGFFLKHVGVSDPSQLVIDQWDQFCQSLGIASTPSLQQLSNFVWSAHAVIEICTLKTACAERRLGNGGILSANPRIIAKNCWSRFAEG